MKGGINLSPTSQKILTIFFSHPDQKFYVNELIRLTGLYPNSIQQALKSLEKQKILISSRSGRLRFYRLDKCYKFISEVEQIVSGKEISLEIFNQQKSDWIKVVNRVNEIPYVYGNFFGQRDNYRKFIGLKFENFWYNGVTSGVYYYRNHIEEGARLISVKMQKDKSFAKRIISLCTNRGEELIRETKKALTLNLPGVSKIEIRRFFSYRLRLFSKFSPFLMLPFSIEAIIEKEINKSLQELGISEERFEMARSLLMEPVDFVSKEQIKELELASLVKKYGWNVKTRKNLLKLTDDFCWSPMYSMLAKPFEEDYFKGLIEEILAKVANPQQEISRLQAEGEKRKKEARDFLIKIKATDYLRDLVTLYQSYIGLRLYRVNVFRRFNYYHLPILNEIGHRMDLDGDEIKYLTYNEMLSWLKHGYGKEFGYSFESLKGEIARRIDGWAILMWKGKIRIITGVKNIIETMEQYRIVAPGPQIQRLVKGNPACRGRAIGRVKVVRKLSELDKVGQGDVLVAKMTTPDYMLAIHKAAAIVTDEGGVTCHAAIVSREFNLPCIVGTRNATQILSDNDLVEVDANEGIVRVVEAVEVDENVRQIYGKTAFKGKVKGPVRIVLDASDFPKVQEGDILVAPQTTPEYLSSLYKVKGFIADEESITSHAMLYAKALRLPALIGTVFARNVLQDGEAIELDATKGVVKRLSTS